MLFTVIVALALSRTRSLRDLVFFAFCAASGFLILRQNFQGAGILTLYAGAAVAAEMLVRAGRSSESERNWSVCAASPLLLLCLLLPTIVHYAVALGLHAAVASDRSGEKVGLPGFEGVRLVNLLSRSEYDSSATYLATLQDGALALSDLDGQPSHVFVLDFVNPFSAGMKVEPARGDSSWQHWERNFDSSHFVPAEKLFQDVRIVMEPKRPVEEHTAKGLREIYGEFLDARFDLVRETEYWKLYLQRS
jgi:hypothetical protein